MRRRHALLALLGLGVLSTLHCATTRSTTVVDAARGGEVRLLDHLDQAVIELPPPLAAREGDIALHEEFTGTHRWFDERFLAAAIEGAPEAASLPHCAHTADGDGVVVLATAGASVTTLVPVDAESTWLISARMKPLAAAEKGAEERKPAALAYLPFCAELPRNDELAAKAPTLAEQLLARPRTRELGGPDDAGWREVTLLAPPYAGRRGIVVTVAGGTDGVAVDHIEVRRITRAEVLALQPDETVEPARHPLRRKQTIGLELWDSLALPSPGRATFRVVVPLHAARFETSVAALADAVTSSPVLSIEVDGRVVASADLAALTPVDASGSHWRRLAIDLSAHAGRTIDLTLRASGGAGAVALFGAPELLGTPAPIGAFERLPPNVVVLSLDTLRADFLGCWGATDAGTPRIDSLARDGVRFERTFSPASFTLPAHLTLLSGQGPLVHGGVKSTQPIDPARTALLAERFAATGARTAAFTGGTLVHPRYGFSLGFDSYSTRDPSGVVGMFRRIGDEGDQDSAPGEERMSAVDSFLERSADQPFFLFLHTYLIHNYRPSQRDLDAIGGGPRPSQEEVAKLRGAASGGDQAAIDRLRQLYRAALRQADREIVGRLLDTLDRLHLRERTLVALVADHGEEFFEHGMIGHGDELWHDLTHVPFIVRGPGVPSGIVRDEPVSLGDIAPTLAALAGLPSDPRVLGRDLFAKNTESDTAADDPPLLLSMRDIAGKPDIDALLQWPWKLIVRRAKDELIGAPQLFDLAVDPDEQHDRATDEPIRVAGMRRRLEAECAAAKRTVASLPASAHPPGFEMSAELQRMLDQLGYGKAGGGDH